MEDRFAKVQKYDLLDTSRLSECKSDKNKHKSTIAPKMSKLLAKDALLEHSARNGLKQKLQRDHSLQTTSVGKSNSIVNDSNYSVDDPKAITKNKFYKKQEIALAFLKRVEKRFINRTEERQHHAASNFLTEMLAAEDKKVMLDINQQ